MAGIFLLGLAHPTRALEPVELFTALAQVERSDATFVETRSITSLTSPIIREGRLRYVRPDRIELIVEKPRSEQVVVAGDMVSLTNRDGTRKARLADLPEVAAWVESVRATLAGDAAGLARYFTVRVDGTMKAWTLSLTPVDAALADVITRITVSGVQSRINRIEASERSGDTSSMLITPAPAGR